MSLEETSKIQKSDLKQPTSLVDTVTNDRWQLEGDRITLGRREDNTVCLANDIYASGNHAQIFLDKGEYWLRDLGSSNGTLINGVTLTKPVKINPGDVVVIGRTRLEVN